jgi:nitronate monooxygenase
MPQYLCALLGTKLPLIQAPMAGSSGVRLAIAVAQAGGLGSLPCAMITPEQIRAAVAAFRAAGPWPINLNFFAHENPAPDAAREAAWLQRLKPYYDAFNLPLRANDATRAPFDETLCALLEALRPEIVSFHFGLPAPALVARVRATGAKILSSATTPAEARWLEARGCDAVIAQGAEAGGHRGMFLTADIATQIGTMALMPLIADAVRVPVIASGGLGDARGVTAAFALGASGVQIGTAYLRCPECETTPIHRAALAKGGETAIVNVFTGRPARGLLNRFVHEMGPMAGDVPAFPRAAGAYGPLRTAAEAQGSGAFSPLWAGQAFALAVEQPAGTLTQALMVKTGP